MVISRPALVRVVPFAIYMAFIFVGDVLGKMGWGGADLRPLYGVKIAAVVLALLLLRHHYTELLWQRLPVKTWFLAIVTGLVVLVLWIALDLPWMQIGTAAGFDPHTNGSIDWSLVAIRIAGGALVVPVMEELFWRSFLLRWIERPDFLALAPALVGARAFIITMALFGIEHNLWLAGMVAGAAYSWLYMRSGQLWPAIVAHGVTNGVLGLWIISNDQWTYW